MNEMKIDKLNLLLTSGLIDKNTQKPVVANEPEAEGVTVTNHLKQLASLISVGDAAPTEQARVLEMKQKIQSNGYTVDVDKLAQKLIKSGGLLIEG